MTTNRTRSISAGFGIVLALGLLSACSSDSKSTVDSARSAASSAAGSVLSDAANSARSDLSSASSSAKSDLSSASSALGAKADKAVFCTGNAAITAAVNAAGNDPVKLAVAFRALDSTFDTYLGAAPDDIKADATKLVDAARASAQSGDVSAFSSSELQTASSNVDSYCSQGTN